MSASPAAVRKKLKTFILNKSPLRRSPRLQGRQRVSVTENTPKSHTSKRKLSRDISASFSEPQVKRPQLSNQHFDTLIGIINSITGLKYRITLCDDSSFLEVSRKVACLSPDGVPYETARVVTQANGQTYFQALNSSKELECNIFCGDGSINEEEYKILLDRLSAKWYFCWGIPKEVYQEKTQHIRYTPKLYKEQQYPYPAVISANCGHWFEGPKKGKVQTLDNGATCRECMTFLRRMKVVEKRNSAIPAKQIESRTEASSSYPIHLLSPKSRTKRMQTISTKRQTDKKTISSLRAKLAETTVLLEEEQNNEMENISRIINENYRKDLDSIFAEAEKKKSGQSRELLEEIWQRDCIDRKTFYDDQSKNGELYDNNFWGKLSCISYDFEGQGQSLRSPMSKMNNSSFQSNIRKGGPRSRSLGSMSSSRSQGSRSRS